MHADSDYQKCPACLASVRGGEYCSNCGGRLEAGAAGARPVRVVGESIWALLGKLLLGGLLVIFVLIGIDAVCNEPRDVPEEAASEVAGLADERGDG